jgi:hypothetical protein
VYIEGVDFAQNHHTFPLFGSFGCTFVDAGNDENVQWLSGEADTFTAGHQFDYQYGSDSDFDVDVISADEGTLLFASQDGLGRGVYHDGDNQYHTIVSSIVFGAIIDTESPNTKADLMHLYLTNLTQPVVSVEDQMVPVAGLKGNYPNPFNPETTIAFTIGAPDTSVRIDIFNVKGEKINTFLDAILPSGNHSVIWNGTDTNNHGVSSGIYFYKMQTEQCTEIKKMILMK